MFGNRQFLRIFLLLRVFLTHFIHVPYPRFIPKSAFYPHIRVLSSYPRFIPISAFYPHIRVLSPYPCFIPISAFYPHIRVLSPYPRFIPITAFYPHIRVLSPYPCFIPISAPPIRSAPSIRPSAPRFILTRPFPPVLRPSPFGSVSACVKKFSASFVPQLAEN